MDKYSRRIDLLSGALTLMLCAAGTAAALWATAHAPETQAAVQEEEPMQLQLLSVAAAPAPLTEQSAEPAEPEQAEPEPEELQEEAAPEPEPEPEPVVEQPAPEPVPKPKPVVKPKPEPRPVVHKPAVKARPHQAPAPHKTQKTENAATAGNTGAAVQAEQAARAAAAVARQNRYASLLHELSVHKEYPSRARRQGLEGTCVLVFTVNTAGKVTAAGIQEKTPHLILNTSCKRLGSRMLGFDTHTQGQETIISVPVHYRLTD